MSKNKNLNKASKEKNDEFYTQLSDIEREVFHYKDHLKGKVVFCNCDNPSWSQFYIHFAKKFHVYGLKKLIATSFHKSKPTHKIEIDESNYKLIDIENPPLEPLKQNGDFRSPECIELLKEADIVITNPPFSLFREFISTIEEHNKKFLIIGNHNAVTYREIFNLVKDNKLWLGHGFKGGNAYFKTPHAKEFANNVYDEKTGLVKFRNVSWFTNLESKKRSEELILYKTYKGNENNYPKYDNYDAIEVSKVADIPMDYDGFMGVPITFLDKHNPEQFEILGLDDHRVEYPKLAGCNSINGKKIYRRIIIKNKNPQIGE
jgi:hypothetical protein